MLKDRKESKVETRSTLVESLNDIKKLTTSDSVNSVSSVSLDDFRIKAKITSYADSYF